MNHFPPLFLGDDECAITNIRAFRFSESLFLLQEFQMWQIPRNRDIVFGEKEKERGENGALLNYSLSRGGELKMTPALHRIRFRGPKQKRNRRSAMLKKRT
ncbi:hypothetical protein CDAR_33341 [Caerostris darwini]|uniref:Uncharacterized protein n=1 Tax=Caerostris darwini TaxID=1538125 RepID=A0AAV4T837_9ARAC|nr:hypothetical protein CDAR_33341 [Caerostris darwini]